MKQLIQNYKTGKIELTEVPIPSCTSNSVLVRNHASLISLGTERSVIEHGAKSILGKAKARPDLVKRFFQKVQTEGLAKSIQEAMARLDNPTPLGYSSAGTVTETGKDVHQFSPGDRVACIGSGYASHSEFISVPENLCCKIPENLTMQDAAFGMVGAIALNGIRCANLTFGETVVVIGLGLLGQLTTQILKAYGCKVIAMDINPKKLGEKNNFTADFSFNSRSAVIEGTEKITKGYGADAAIITTASSSSGPIDTSLEIIKSKGTIVLVGTADIHPERNDMWHKEAQIIVSKAAGPGTFDPIYENKGVDYPLSHVRWTENRNLEELIHLISKEKINTKNLISHKFKIEEAEDVYQNILKDTDGVYTGVIFEYKNKDTFDQKSSYPGLPRKKTEQKTNGKEISVGVIGSGLFAKSLLLPALTKIKNIHLHTLATTTGTSSHFNSKKFSFKEPASTNYKEVIENKDIDAVMILTPHSTHSKMTIEALNEKKHIYVEKPLCISEAELNEIKDTLITIESNAKTQLEGPLLVVGYNRRFSPHVQKTINYLENRKDPLIINYRINAGYISPEHWVHDEKEGGSRIVGELCHFIDLVGYLTSSKVCKIYAERISGNNKTSLNSDNIAVTLKFTDGSIANLTYTASGDRGFSRERIEMFFDGNTIHIEDFKTTEIFFSGKKNNFRTSGQQMGYQEELQNFFDAISGNEISKLTKEEIFMSTLTTFKILESLQKGSSINI